MWYINWIGWITTLAQHWWCLMPLHIVLRRAGMFDQKTIFTYIYFTRWGQFWIMCFFHIHSICSFCVIACDGCCYIQYSNGRVLFLQSFSVIRMQNSIRSVHQKMLFSFYICIRPLSMYFQRRVKLKRHLFIIQKDGCVVLGFWTIHLSNQTFFFLAVDQFLI